MQVYGDIQSLKKAIKGHYDQLVKKRESETSNQVNLLAVESNRQIGEARAKKAVERENEARKIKARVLNERRLQAKRRFEEAREEMIASVLTELKRKLPSISQEKRYLGFVRKHAPEGKADVVRANSSSFKGICGGKFVLDKSVNGVILESESVLYDFDLGAMLEAKKQQLRPVIAGQLFGEGK